MGGYDITKKGAQVKLWDCEFRTIEKGSLVGGFYPEYVVLLQEGGFIKVNAGKVVELVEDRKPRYPEDFDIPCLDKWGSLVTKADDLKGNCMFGYDYYFLLEEKRKCAAGGAVTE